MKLSINLISKKLLALSVVFLLHACTIVQEPIAGDPTFAPVISSTTPMPSANNGGIYRPGYTGGLFEDRSAARVGDILSVILDERTNASKTADTEITKDNDVTLNEGSILGDNVSFGDYSLGTSVTQEREFTGESSSDQSNSLTGSIAVTVAEILPNGLLLVRGEKWMTLNRGQEYIRLKGLVRPEDINPDNTVLSTLLADARITYSGTGDLADSNRQGWLARFFNTEYWPF